MKYAHLEKDSSKLLGWYDSEIHSEIPVPNVEVKEKVWQDAININANCYENKVFILKDFRTEEEVESHRITGIKSKASELILSKYPTFKQTNAQLGLSGQVYLDEMIVFIKDIVQQSDKLELDTSKTYNDFSIKE